MKAFTLLLILLIFPFIKSFSQNTDSVIVSIHYMSTIKEYVREFKKQVQKY